MSKPIVVKERTRYKYINEEEAIAAKSKQQKEKYAANLEENRKKNAEYQRRYRAAKKQELENLRLEKERLANILASQQITSNEMSLVCQRMSQL